MIKGCAVLSMLAVVVAMTAACTHQADSAPPLAGPSQLAMAVTMTANPDRISLDGGSQSLVTVQVRGPNGQVQVNVPLRVDMVVNGVVQDYGKLNSRNIVTGTDGNAFVVYTAPALAAGANQPYATVSIQALIVGTDAAATATHAVIIALVPSGVILPPADTPTASFVVTPTPVNLNVAASFDASASCPGAKNSVGCLPSSSAVITNYAWSFGDGATSSGKTVNHTYASIGSFNATLTITNDRGITASTTQAISVGTTTAPTAVFVFSPSAPGINQSVNFNATASAAAPGRAIASYSWNFGDAGTGGGVTIAHAFAAAGSYNVTLTVKDDLGQSNTATQSVAVSSVGGGGGPTAAFTFSPTTPGVSQTVNFNASASTAGAGHTIASYGWNFGDGTTAALVTTTHVFAAAGTYVVTLTVTDDIGQKGTISQNVTITAGPGALPTAVFTFSPAQPGVGENVFFNAALSTAGPGRTLTAYNWTFGDNTTGVGVTPTHAFATAGTYSVQLKVTDDLGQTALSTVQQITPGNPPAPTANFTFSPSAPGQNDQVVFDASSSSTSQGQTIVDVAWNFGDGTPVIHCPGGGAACPGPTNRISVNTFHTAQTFIVNLVVTDSAGRTGSHNTSVTVALALPVVSITTSPSGPNPGTTVFFNSNSTLYYPGSGPVTFAWTFGDGATSAAANPTHPYGAAGTYSVGLAVTDTKGRTGVGSATVTVVAVTPPAPPVAAFTSSPPSPSLGAGGVVSFDGSTSSSPSGAALNLYRWNFGDGTIISGPPGSPAPAPGGTFQAPRHTYLSIGSYTVTLTVTDTNGLSGSTTGTVTVGP